MSETGAFATDFAAKKNWRRDPGLSAAILDWVGTVKREEHGKELRICDYGAGIGQYVALLREHGHDAIGLDGTEGIIGLSEGRVRQADFTDEPYWSVDWGATPHIAISVEVGEHVPVEHAQTYLRWITGTAQVGIMMSWAVPGQRGRGHVNCRSPEWVACEMGKLGKRLVESATARARNLAGRGWDRKLMIFA